MIQIRTLREKQKNKKNITNIYLLTININISV